MINLSTPDEFGGYFEEGVSPIDDLRNRKSRESVTSACVNRNIIFNTRNNLNWIVTVFTKNELNFFNKKKIFRWGRC